MYTSTKKMIYLAGPLALLTAAPSGMAQSNEQGDSVTGIEEVIVTARRRDESLQDVPLSLTAFTGDQLERIGAADIVAVAQTAPNVTLEVSRGTNTTLTAFIRGVGQQDPVAGFEAGVGIYLDDVYLNRPQAAVLDIYDVERVEILRGPQGTLYGRNTIGGAVKYVTNGLSDTPQAKFRLSYGSFNQLDAVVTGSTPISDTLQIGGSVARLTRDGFGDNLNLTDLENYNNDLLAGRMSIEWDATDDLWFRLSGDMTQDDSDPRQGHRLTVSNMSGAPILPNVFDTRAGLNSPHQEVESSGGSLVANWSMNDQFTIKNILAYREDESHSPIDFDSLPADDLDVPVIYKNRQFSEELQINYESDRLAGVFGFYLLDANAFNNFDVILGPLGAAIGLPGYNANTYGDVDTDSWSLYADFSYQFSDTISLSIGGRYTSDERTSRVLRTTYIGGASPGLGGAGIPIAVTSDFLGEKEFNEFSPKASISWQPTDEQHLYLTYSEGFKGGSFDPRGQSSAAPDLDGDGDVDEADIFEFMMFEPEYVKSYEIGLKSAWLDNRVTTSFSLFHADYTDIQIPGSIGYDSDGDGTVDSFLGITSNAGDADMDGFEFEGLAQLSEALSFSWAIGYLDAEFNEFIDAFGVDVSDERVFQNTPKVTASGSLTYEWPLSLMGTPGSIAAITTLSYRDDTSQFEVPNELLDQASYSLLDFSLVWEDDAGHWRAGIHGKNLTDEEYKVAGYNFPTLGLEGSVTAFYGNPRTVTATVEYRF